MLNQQTVANINTTITNVPIPIFMRNFPQINTAFEVQYRDYRKNITENQTSVIDQFNTDLYDSRYILSK